MNHNISDIETFYYPYSKEDLTYLSKHYDATKSLLSLPLSKISRNKNPLLKRLRLHPTRDSLNYALLLLHKNIRIKEVEAILVRIVNLQNQDTQNSNYGCWPKYLESTYLTIPGKYWKFDRNWTDFIGLGLLRILLNNEYCARLDLGLIEAITSSITHAAIAIEKRNVRYIYTNICVMDMCITLLAGKILNNESLYKYGLNSLDEVHKNTVSCNCFAEYNSPTYSLITLKTLYYLKSIIEDDLFHDKAVEEKVDKLFDIAWQEISNYFHPSTGQWAGPHSRSYSELLESEAEHFIKAVIIDSEERDQKELQAQSIGVDSTPLKVQVVLRSPFLTRDKPRIITRYISYRNPPQVLRTYLTPAFTVGTVNYSDLWHQRNSLAAYWGTNEAPRYLSLRCLHNGKDFSAAQFFSAQEKGNIVGAINLATDISKENPYIPKSKVHQFGFLTHDLRIRFEFGSAFQPPSFKILKESNSSLTFECDSMYFNFSIPYAKFDSSNLKWSISKNNKKTSNLDIVLHSGFIKLINLSNIDSAVASFHIQMAESMHDLVEQSVGTKLVGDTLTLTVKDLSLSVSSRPKSIKELRECFIGTEYKYS